jgi:hypothetical protein
LKGVDPGGEEGLVFGVEIGGACDSAVTDIGIGIGVDAANGAGGTVGAEIKVGVEISIGVAL